uniref:Interleukin-33 n=1 Tax=Balaenoptera musculus TaxID=9771 RepID=A0A8C0CHL1_BALMU
MKPKMKYSTTKISPAKMHSSAGKALVKSPTLRKSQQKAEEVCPMYSMQLRSGLKIEKKTCYFRKETTKRHSPRTAKKYKEQRLVFAACQELEHIGQSVKSFTFDKTRVQKYTTATGLPSIKDKVLLRYYDSQFPSSETDGGGDHRKLMVNLSPTKDKDFLLHANSKEHSVELQKCENPLPEQAFFVLHEETSQCVSFECKSNPGVFLGVKDNHLALIKRGEHPEDSNEENTIFKLT